MAHPGGLTARPDVPDAVLCLVRHAESTWIAEGRFQGRRDPPLSSLGERQARQLAARLRDRSQPPALPLPGSAPAAIWHSPLERAAATARAVAELIAPGQKLQASEALYELGQGDWEGLTHADVGVRWPVELAAWREDPLTHQAPNGERLRDGAERVAAAMRTILTGLSHDPEREGATLGAASPAPWAVVISHDGILRLALLQLLRVPIDHFWSFPFPLAGISVLDIADGRARLRCHGLTDHLRAPTGVDRGGAL